MNTMELSHDTITVAKIFRPTEEGKGARIKGTDGQMLGVWPDKLHLVQEGGTYDFGYSVKGVYRNIQTIKEVAPPRQEPAPLAAAAKPAPQPNGNGGGYYRPTSPRDAERMWVCSTIGHFIETGRLELDSEMLTQAVNILRTTWQNTFGKDET